VIAAGPAAVSAGVELVFSLLNYEGGGLHEDGTHDLKKLVRAFTPDPEPDVIVICEAKGWQRDGRKPFLTGIRELSALCGRPYVGELHAGPLPTAIIYDPAKLCLLVGEDTDFPDRCSRARFALRADGTSLFELRAEHWSYSDSGARFARAQRLAQYGVSTTPTLIIGDLNESASGPDYPDLDWDAVPLAVRDYVACRTDNGVWAKETSALDRLIGAYDPQTGCRIDGSGFHSMAELDSQAGRPFPATSNVRNLHVDYALGNNAMLRIADVVPGSYRVHVPVGEDRSQWPSDHRRVSFVLRFNRTTAAWKVA
jgi:hypothetical protein